MFMLQTEKKNLMAILNTVILLHHKLQNRIQFIKYIKCYPLHMVQRKNVSKWKLDLNRSEGSLNVKEYQIIRTIHNYRD